MYSYNDYIESTNDTGNGAAITVTGNDGNSTGVSTYELTINKTGSTITITAENTTTGVTEPAVIYIGAKVRFGNGLYVELPDEWPYSGDTVFTIEAGPQRTFTLGATGSDNHWFMITAERNDGVPEQPSAWKAFSTSMPPNPVTDVSFAYVSATEVDVTFTLPEDTDIAGAYIRHSWPGATGYDIPFPSILYNVSGTSLQTKTQRLSNLIEGQYWLNIRAYDESGLDDRSDYLYNFFLGADALSFGTIARPKSFRAKPVGLGKVQFEVRTNGAEDEVAIYTDETTGTIDTDNIWALFTSSDIVVENVITLGASQAGRLYRKTVTNVPEGIYQFLARCRKLGTEEKNTDVLAGVSVYDTAVGIPSSITVVRNN